ncbi:MAG: hypothetical protein IJS32_00515 [Kiritimatiellae bacterium]|nr:hypothetical protein [Kiritimatiellia bacterium]
MNPDRSSPPAFDAANLYREEVFSDMKTGTIRRLVPVTADGAEDPSRKPVYTASAQIATPGGLLPLSGEIEGAATLAEAAERFSATIQAALEDLRREMEALQRERASQIVVPGRGAPLGPAGGGAPGDLIL